jgi:hypothetical protein
MMDEENNKQNLSDKDKELLERMRPGTRKGFRLFPSSGDNDERSWISRNVWWIIVIIAALIINWLL